MRRRTTRPAAPAHVAAGPDPGVEATLRRLELLVTRRLDGLLLGDHLGLLPGSGTERAESRAYRVGDDVRRMDWSVTARTTVPHVYDLVADRELETWVVVDQSASMEFGTALAEKRELAVNAVAAVGFLSARSGNRLGAVVLGGAGGPLVLPARSGGTALRSLLRTLLSQPRTGRDRGARPGQVSAAGGGLAAGLEQLQRPPRRRGLVVVVSDFLDGMPPPGATGGDGTGPAGWERPLRALSARHQVLAVEVVDPRELTLPDVGVLTLVDPETGALLDVSTRSRGLRERYARAAAAQRADIALGLRRAGAGHLQLRTDGDWLADVVRHVLTERRRRLGARSPVRPAAVVR